MILAINANAALDRIYFVKRFVPNSHMRAKKEKLSVGGKGLDTALVLRTLNAPVQALSFIAGKNGRELASLLEEAGVQSELIWLPGDTRISNVIVETDLNRHSHITTQGYSINEQDCQNFLDKVSKLAENAQWAVIAGSMPHGAPVDFYGQVINILHQHGVKVLIDGFGQPILEALAADPDILKMNQAEITETFDMEAENWLEWYCIGQTLRKRYGLEALVITCGKDGIITFSDEGIYHAGGKEVAEVNAAGAGDAVSAALVYRFSEGDNWPQALAWAVAASTAVVLTEGTAECYWNDIREIYPLAWVKKIEHI